MPLTSNSVLPRTFYGTGAPVNGTDHVYTLTIGGTPTSGTFRLGLNGETTSAITWSATTNTILANIDAALEALRYVGSGGFTCAAGTLSSGIGTITITATNQLAKRALASMTIASNNLAGTAPTLAVATTTAGVDCTNRGAVNGSDRIDLTTGLRYRNIAGTTVTPIWSADAGHRIDVPLVGNTIHAGVTAWQNAYAFSVKIYRAMLHITTASTGASTIDIGGTSVSATTASDTLIDGLSGAATGLFDNITNKGSNGLSVCLVASGKWVTQKEASGDTSGLVGVLSLFFVPVL